MLPQRKDLSNDLTMILEAIVAAHQCGDVCQNPTVNVFRVWD